MRIDVLATLFAPVGPVNEPTELQTGEADNPGDFLSAMNEAGSALEERPAASAQDCPQAADPVGPVPLNNPVIIPEVITPEMGVAARCLCKEMAAEPDPAVGDAEEREDGGPAPRMDVTAVPALPLPVTTAAEPTENPACMQSQAGAAFAPVPPSPTPEDTVAPPAESDLATGTPPPSASDGGRVPAPSFRGWSKGVEMRSGAPQSAPPSPQYRSALPISAAAPGTPADPRTAPAIPDEPASGGSSPQGSLSPDVDRAAESVRHGWAVSGTTSAYEPTQSVPENAQPFSVSTVSNEAGARPGQGTRRVIELPDGFVKTAAPRGISPEVTDTEPKGATLAQAQGKLNGPAMSTPSNAAGEPVVILPQPVPARATSPVGATPGEVRQTIESRTATETAVPSGLTPAEPVRDRPGFQLAVEHAVQGVSGSVDQASDAGKPADSGVSKGAPSKTETQDMPATAFGRAAENAKLEQDAQRPAPAISNAGTKTQHESFEPHLRERFQDKAAGPAFASEHEVSGTGRVTVTRATPLSTSADRTEFILQLSQRIQAQCDAGGGVLRIQLRPANLGRLEISAEPGAAGLVARIVTESPAVRQYLDGNLHVLEQALTEQGLRIERLDVVTQSSDLRHSTNQQNQAGGSGHPDRGGAAVLEGGAGAAGTVEIAADPAALNILGPNSTFHTVA